MPGFESRAGLTAAAAAMAADVVRGRGQRTSKSKSGSGFQPVVLKLPHAFAGIYILPQYMYIKNTFKFCDSVDSH